MQEELLAQLVEEVSVLAAQHTRPEPLSVTRPPSVEAHRQLVLEQARSSRVASNSYQESADGAVTAVGHRQLLSYIQERG